MKVENYCLRVYNIREHHLFSVPWNQTSDTSLPKKISEKYKIDFISCFTTKKNFIFGLTLLNINTPYTMLFNTLIKSTSWLSVELTLLQLYPDQENMLDEYRNVFEKLKILETEENDMSIVLTEYQSDDEEEDTYVDVSGRKNEKEPDDITDGYALEFVPWKRWLGMELAPESIKYFSDLEIIAHCLYEMTFIGYDEEEIQEQFDSINKTVEDYKSLSEEEKKNQTTSLEELKKRLDKNESDGGDKDL